MEKNNTTKAHIRQSKEMYYNTKKLKTGGPGIESQGHSLIGQGQK